MVLKFGSEPEDVFMIEATSNLGVSIRNFARIKPHIGTFYTKVAIRHLDWERPDASLDILEQFLEEVNGREYNMSMDMLNKKNTRNLANMPMAAENDEGRAKLLEDGRAFFCSELVVKAWKVC